MAKYDISDEFKLFKNFKPKFNRSMINNFNKLLKTPSWLKKDKELNVKSRFLKGDNDKFEVLIISLKDIDDNAPCLFFIHGGAFIIHANEHHYKEAAIYAKVCKVKVIFVKYNLATNNQILTPLNDSFIAFKWMLDNIKELNIDKNRIGLIGDSAGGNISASLYLKLKKENINIKLKFLMLLYPFLDYTFSSESSKKYLDTPMWNSNMSKRLFEVYAFNNIKKEEHVFISPILNKDYKNYPPTYIESCEYDPLHDDAINYYKILKDNNVKVHLNETKYTMHGFDIVMNSTITICNLFIRIEYIKRQFSK